jgi:hypothetical protein
MAKLFLGLRLFPASYLYSSYLFFSYSLSYQRLKVKVLYWRFNTKTEYVSLCPQETEFILEPSPLMLSELHYSWPNFWDHDCRLQRINRAVYKFV